jgi:hypothetical protein
VNRDILPLSGDSLRTCNPWGWISSTDNVASSGMSMCVLRNFRYPLSLCRKPGYGGANLGVRPPRVPRYLLANAAKHRRNFGFPRRKGRDYPKPDWTRSVFASGKSENQSSDEKFAAKGDGRFRFDFLLEYRTRTKVWAAAAWGRFHTIRLLLST